MLFCVGVRTGTPLQTLPFSFSPHGQRQNGSGVDFWTLRTGPESRTSWTQQNCIRVGPKMLVCLEMGSPSSSASASSQNVFIPLQSKPLQMSVSVKPDIRRPGLIKMGLLGPECVWPPDAAFWILPWLSRIKPRPQIQQMKCGLKFTPRNQQSFIPGWHLGLNLNTAVEFSIWTQSEPNDHVLSRPE